MGRAIAAWVLALIVLAQGTVVAQTIEPKAMTKDEIEKELRSASQFTGTVSLNANPLCSFDSNKAQSLPLGYFNRNEPKPSNWAVVTATPALVITLSSDVPNRVQGDVVDLIDFPTWPSPRLVCPLCRTNLPWMRRVMGM